MARRTYDFSAYMERLWKEGYSNKDIFDLYCQTVFEVMRECRGIDGENLIFLNVKTLNKITDMEESERQGRIALARLGEG